jgi:hypothetical protein
MGDPEEPLVSGGTTGDPEEPLVSGGTMGVREERLVYYRQYIEAASTRNTS